MNAQVIKERLNEALERQIQVYPCKNLRASNLGHPCERYLYLLLTKWEEQKPHDKELQSIFNLGNKMEEFVIEQLKNAGFEVITPTQRSWKIDKPLITGREDLRIKDENGELLPCEIKGLSPMEFERLNSIEDFLNSKKYYIRAYPTQLFIYMYKFAKEHGLFILVNKLTGEIKPIDVYMDYNFGEAQLQKAERIYKAIDEKKTPEPCADCSVCENCSLQHVCGRVDRLPTDIELDDELDELIAEKEELKPLVSKAKELDEQIKSKIGERLKVLTGTYLIERKSFVKKAYTVAEHIEFRTNIKKLI